MTGPFENRALKGASSFYGDVSMDEKTELQIRQIASFWLKFEFLENFKKLGEKYAAQIKKELTTEKNNNRRTENEII